MIRCTNQENVEKAIELIKSKRLERDSKQLKEVEELKSLMGIVDNKGHQVENQIIVSFS